MPLKQIKVSLVWRGQRHEVRTGFSKEDECFRHDVLQLCNLKSCVVTVAAQDRSRLPAKSANVRGPQCLGGGCHDQPRRALLSGASQYGAAAPPLLTLWVKTCDTANEVRVVGTMSNGAMVLYTINPNVGKIADSPIRTVSHRHPCGIPQTHPLLEIRSQRLEAIVPGNRLRSARRLRRAASQEKGRWRPAFPGDRLQRQQC